MSKTTFEIKSRDVYLAEQVDQKSIFTVKKQIRDICEADKAYADYAKLMNCVYQPEPIRLHIDSYGGQVYQILGLIDEMHIANMTGTPVDTYVTGCAMSAGFICLISGRKRYATSNSWVLYHQVSSGTWGKVEEMEEKVDQIRNLNNQLHRIIQERTRLTLEQLQEVDRVKKDWYISAQEALDLGCIDAII